MKKIAVLTSSRADYGIYLPLLHTLNDHDAFELEIIAFGSHLSPFHGYTLNEIIEDGFNVKYKVNSLLLNDDENSVASGFALTTLKFADFWVNHENEFDLVFCLGDRFEMYGAVSAGIPYGVKFAHIHGGETTLGAIDNIYRHSISLAAKLHFTSTEEHSQKVTRIIGSDKDVYNVGALSLDGINEINFVDEAEFRERYSIPEGDFVLTTFHPESNNSENNFNHVFEMSAAIKQMVRDYIFVFSMPNADTLGSVFREEIKKLKNLYPERIVWVENFGKNNYFSAMKYSSFMLGNSSSGIIEAASFNKYVVNVGDRQKGRTTSDNVIHTVFVKDDIIKGISEAETLGKFNGKNKYYMENSSNEIIKTLKRVLKRKTPKK